mmetsp:Transcript_17717/g.26020  ORF Transcript_17717/g.26020 Transcript_17717/m.26020 type:complete len:576 (+) Transcript_17717:123-1850(+)
MLRSTNYTFFTTIIFITVFLGQREQFARYAEAKEIVATSEWTLLGENDTVPAGLHIKVDLTTGQKWAKLVDEKEDGDTMNAIPVEAEVTVNGDASTSLSVVSTTSSSSSVWDVVSEVPVSGDDEDDEDDSGKKDSYDYAAMYRTLSNLPSDEKERMGGLPELPASYGTSSVKLTKKEKAAFEKKMKALWEARQEEIRKFQEEFVADMPKILRARIDVLKSYVRDPSTHLRKLDLNKDDEYLEEDTPDEAEEEDEKYYTLDIIEALKDIEYHLSDIDMARDFYTLGGWPYLLSLLSDSVHYRAVAPVNETSSEFMEITAEKINAIQMYAAWVVGTAVKNTEEFHGWATEKVILVEPGKENDGNEDARSEPLSAISLLISSLKASSSAVSGGKKYFNMERQKNLYALGGLLRGNRSAQRHFIELGGPDALVKTVSESIESAVERKYASRTLLLADDIIADLVLHGIEDGLSEEDVKNWIHKFTSPGWCDLPIRMLGISNVPIREKAIQSLGTMSPYCIESSEDAWRKEASDALKKVQRELMQGGMITNGGEGEDGLNPEYRKELVDLAAGVLDGLTS